MRIRSYLVTEILILILNNSSLLYYVMADAVVVVHSPSLPPKNKPATPEVHLRRVGSVG